jgi:hypothetical protein
MTRLPSTRSESTADNPRQSQGASRAAGTSRWRLWIAGPAVVLAILLSAFFLIQSFVPLRTAVQIGADEGFELTKATVCLNGYKLYSEVWNDQPPLHTFLITQILKHISPSILGPRLVTSVFAAVLLAAVFFTSLRISGLFVAALATALLIVSPGFIELSSSCMLEIPALAPAVAALGAFLIGSQSKWQMNPNGPDETAEHAACAKGKSRDSFTQRVRRTASNAASRALFSRGSRISRFTPTAFSRIKELLAGVLFGIAFQIKLVNVILLPLAALIVWLRQQETGFSHGPNRPTPDPSQEGNNSSSPSRPLPSSGGAVGGFMNKTAKARHSRNGVTLFRSPGLQSLSPAFSSGESVRRPGDAAFWECR